MPKFSSYSTIAGASVASGDYALILDVSDTTLGSTGTQKKITIPELAVALGTSTLSFSTVIVAGQSNVVADSSSDTLTLVAGSNITITTDASTDTITIAAAGGSSLPVVDSTAIVKGSDDPTKQIRLEVDGLTTGTTRVLTAPDADGTLPLLSLAQTWTAQQTFAIASPTAPVVVNSTGVANGDSVYHLRLQQSGLDCITFRTSYADNGTSSTYVRFHDPDTGGYLAALGFVPGTEFSLSYPLRVSGDVYLDSGNIRLGLLATAGANADGVAVIKSGTPPTTFPADTVQVWSADHAAGDARLFVRTESGSTPIEIGNGTITGLSSPTASGDAATKGYVDTAVTGLLDFKGSTDCSASPNYPSASKGDCYIVSVAGKIGGASGKSVDIGDVYLATADNAGGAEGTVGTSWTVLEHNLAGALLAANNLSDLASASTARTNLGLGTAAVKDTGTSGSNVPLLDGANSWSGSQALAGNATIGSGSAAGTLTAVAPGSGAGNGLSLIASAAASGNTAGGNVLLQPGAKSGSGTDGKVIIRQPGGTAGTDEIQVYHDGTRGVITCQDGVLRVPGTISADTVTATVALQALSGANVQALDGSSNQKSIVHQTGQIFSSDAGLTWRNNVNVSAGSADCGLARAAAGVIQVTNGSTGAGALASAARAPAQITAGQNNYSPGVGLFQRWSSDASQNVTGMTAGVDGETRYVWNVGANNIVLSHESASSTAANRFTSATGADLTLAANKCVLAMYDSTSARWRVTLLP